MRDTRSSGLSTCLCTVTRTLICTKIRYGKGIRLFAGLIFGAVMNVFRIITGNIAGLCVCVILASGSYGEVIPQDTYIAEPTIVSYNNVVLKPGDVFIWHRTENPEAPWLATGQISLYVGLDKASGRHRFLDFRADNEKVKGENASRMFSGLLLFEMEFLRKNREHHTGVELFRLEQNRGLTADRLNRDTEKFASEVWKNLTLKDSEYGRKSAQEISKILKRATQQKIKLDDPDSVKFSTLFHEHPDLSGDTLSLDSAIAACKERIKPYIARLEKRRSEIEALIPSEQESIDEAEELIPYVKSINDTSAIATTSKKISSHKKQIEYYNGLISELKERIASVQ